MCSSDPALPKEVKCAKCMGIAIFVFAIFSMIGFIGGAIAGGVAGIMACVASSILMCCGPKADGTGAGKELAAAILYILAGIVHFVGAVLGLLWYFALAEDVKKHCDDLCKDWETQYNWDTWQEYESRAECDAQYDQTCKDYESTTLGFLAILIFPTVGFCVVCGILEIIGAVLCFKAKKAVEASAGGAAAAKDANPVNV
jgi:hypothetical protein